MEKVSWRANLKAGGCLGSASSDVNNFIAASPLRDPSSL